VAVVAFFWRDWINIFIAITPHPSLRATLSRWERGLGGEGNKESYSKNLLWLLMIASVPGAIFGFWLDDYAEKAFRNPLLIAFTLGVVGLALYLVDKYATHKKDINHMSLKDAIIIGLSQAVAIIPGVSRSGATMTAGLSLGLSREQAARFSFLLSTPIIFGAAVFKFPELLKAGITLPIIVGIIVAAVSGYLAIKYMLRFIQKVGYAPFFWYRLILAVAVVIFYFLKT
jgi:undecaprenyl-diphosphatase